MNEHIDTWNINNRINLYLLDNIDDAHLTDIAASKGRNVGEQFAHIHNVRLMWLKASAPELLDGLEKIEKTKIRKKLLAVSLADSAPAIEKLLAKGFRENKIKNFKPHPYAFLGYLLAHEAHHRGQIILSLKQSGRLPDKKILFGLWEWGTR
ncbi:MAG: hypothetical protein JO072_01275 [Parafilimonas sp.]|nr:hypothetical protein [Parafilimonas sp.]